MSRSRGRRGEGGRGRETTTFSLSFLDVIACGFGAIVLLLVLTKIGEPRALETAQEDLSGRVAALQEELATIRGDTVVLERRAVARREQVAEETERVARLRGDLSKIRGRYAASRELSEVQEILEGRLLAAQQQLSEEMKRLQAQSDVPYRRPQDAPIGGIPVDSEYIVFVIDTSGSMQRYAWPAVLEKMGQVLDAYPEVKGLQVMNDMGQFLFSSYAGKWIPDTPARRRAILRALSNWSPFSNSSPVEGIERAIRSYARGAGGTSISLYVFGDEFTGDSVDRVLERVDQLNLRGPGGERRVRIHAVGFPTTFVAGGLAQRTGERFSTLMRALCERNDGTFVGLTRLR
ncbi:MAG: VWA domain-containing protein [Acidobacteriota bacterium]